jgi:hypothetical protein
VRGNKNNRQGNLKGMKWFYRTFQKSISQIFQLTECYIQAGTLSPGHPQQNNSPSKTSVHVLSLATCEYITSQLKLQMKGRLPTS